ncbi:GNAT family N-acetyltransferase [Streptomyces sp. NPDC047072]|uniref:GNAT family N-acetyltransferase n=1 Tax=Streptomyces sp. NPDC047072 TaxID=3154809 RepID=UPI0033EDFC5B
MRSEDWQLTEDLDDFLGRVGGFLRAQPVSNIMQLTVAQRLREGRGGGAGAAVFGWLERGGEVVGSFYRLPGRGVGLGPLTPEQADSLAVRLKALGHDLPYVSADQRTAVAFAEAWQRHAGAVSTLRVRLHLYRLGTLTPPQPFPAGRARSVGEEDLGALMDMCRGFAADVGEDVTIDAGSWAGTRFADKSYTFWETPDGAPVSMAGVNPAVAGMAQVDPVYTPAHHRGHGYAAAVSAQVSRAARDAGAQEVVLFTDAANPTSNALYQRIGYEHVTDWAAYDFT